MDESTEALVERPLRTLRALAEVSTTPSCEVALAAVAEGLSTHIIIITDKIKITVFFIAISFLAL
jgi:hypothetical protein